MNQQQIVHNLLQQRVQLTGYIWAIVRDAHRADDVFQELCLKAMAKADEINDPPHLLAWSRTVARGLALDLIRKSDRRRLVLDERVLDMLEAEWDEHAQPISAEMSEALEHCVSQLSERVQQMIHAQYTEGLATSQVAQKVGMSVAAVYKALARSHQFLNECMKRRMAGGSSGV